MFGEPARAISRNVIIIAFGFLPMLVAALVPYKTTGLLLFAILSISGFSTLLLLPSILTAAQGVFFRAARFNGPAALPPAAEKAVPVHAKGGALER
jgi:hypothetical protein